MLKYVTMIHALNIPCKLETTGDWHSCSIQWEKPHIWESEGSLWGDYGIETNKKIPYHNEPYNVANHIRACLDLLYMGYFTVAEGMHNDFIDDDKYNNDIFEKVIMMDKLPHWDKINEFMTKEYSSEWVNYLDEYNKVNNNVN